MASGGNIQGSNGTAAPKRRADEVPQLTYKVPRKSSPTRSTNAGITESHLRLLREEKCCDVIFLAGQSKERIPCHKSFLAARSPVFEAMFSERWSKRASQMIEISDVDATIFRMFLEFIYANIFEVTVLEAIPLLYVAQKYDVQPLVQQCEDLVKTSMKLENAISVFQAARECWNEKLMEFASDAMVTNKFLNVIFVRHDILKEVDKEMLVYLLKRDYSEAKEVELFKLAVEWGKNQLQLGAKASLDEALDDIIPLIRFPAMTLKEFTAVVVPSGLLKQDVLMQLYTYFGSDKAAQKELAESLNFCITPRKAFGEAVVPLYDEAPEVLETAAIICLQDKIGFKVNVTGNLGNDHFRFHKESNELAITGIILLCPEKRIRIHGGEGQFVSSTDRHDFFRVSIMKSGFTLNDSDYCLNTDNYFDLYFQPNMNKDTVICPVKLEWGQEMEVKIEPPVTLENGRDYLITLQQVHDRYKVYEYGYNPLGGLKQAVAVELGSNNLKMTHVRNCSSGVSVIHKIKFAKQ